MTPYEAAALKDVVYLGENGGYLDKFNFSNAKKEQKSSKSLQILRLGLDSTW